MKVMRMLRDAGDSSMFRNDRKGFVPAYYEGITLGIAQNLEKYEARPELILERIQALKEDREFKKYSGSASNSKSRIKKLPIRFFGNGRSADDGF